MTELSIRRLRPDDADGIVACFRRVYGDTYANEVFYDAQALAGRMAAGSLCPVGALDADGRLLGHMAMTCRPEAVHAELGNTVVDPTARGDGVAWQVGAELTNWCRELGYAGYLHYPTTDHHIMQRRSVRTGFETGLMLGYVPADTDGKVVARDERRRQAATIVFEPFGGPLDQGVAGRSHLPGYLDETIKRLAGATGLRREWRPAGEPAAASRTDHELLARRGLSRLTFVTCGSDVAAQIEAHEDSNAACRQIDFRMDDPGIEAGVLAARRMGYRFCGWLPGYAASDVFRVQKVDPDQTDMAPQLVNPVARELLALIDA